MTDRKAMPASSDSQLAEPQFGNAWPQGRMWSASIVVGHPGHQDFSQVPFAQRNDPIQTLTPQSPNQSFTKRVRLRAAYRRSDYFKPEAD